MKPFLTLLCFTLVCQSAPTVDAADSSGNTKNKVDFAKDVYPILRDRCFKCHRGSNPKSGTRLDHHAKLLGETDGVPLVVPGDSARSLLIRMVSGTGEASMMPPKDSGPLLANAQIAVLKAWIDQGASWDDKLLPDPNLTLAAKHWAFQRIERPEIPKLSNPENRATNAVDALISAKHFELGIKGSWPASKRQLIRRLYLVLHGLPPTRDQVDRFLRDDSPTTWRMLVDRVLESKHFGERVARHWLDSARWAESEGFAQNNHRPFAWRYRDYVIDSFNRDKSYADFLTQQIAGDELEPYSDENLVATGFLAAARISADDLHYYRAENDMYTDIVNTISSSVLGLTVGCSQCHDHKFDPISQRDFYRLHAFFARGFPGNIVMANSAKPDELDQVARDLLALNLKVRKRVLSEGYDESPEPMRSLLHSLEPNRSLAGERKYRPERIRLNIRVAGCNSFRIKEDEKKQLDALKKKLESLVKKASQTWGFYSPITSPHSLSTLPMAGNFPLLHDKKRLADRRSYLLARGQIFETVAVVTPGWPSAFGPTDPKLVQSRPRTALARWLTSRDNPLTARVWVNRIWQLHFGRGLVETTGNFGVRGTKPTHPKLLDWLATELIEHSWSTKHIHRLIVNSRTWQQSSHLDGVAQNRKSAAAIDPNNHYLWRWPRRRLSAEGIRDSMLTVSGELDRTVGGQSIPSDKEAKTVRRAMYLFQKRDDPPKMQVLFDGPTAMAEACMERQVSTSALQALYLLNNDFSKDRSLALAKRIQAEVANGVEDQVELAFQIALGRTPDKIERAAAIAFLNKPNLKNPTFGVLAVFCQALLNVNEFLYIE